MCPERRPRDLAGVVCAIQTLAVPNNLLQRLTAASCIVSHAVMIGTKRPKIRHAFVLCCGMTLSCFLYNNYTATTIINDQIKQKIHVINSGTSREHLLTGGTANTAACGIRGDGDPTNDTQQPLPCLQNDQPPAVNK